MTASRQGELCETQGETSATKAAAAVPPQPFVFEGPQLSSSPFRHFIVDRVFEPVAANMLLAWLEGLDQEWLDHEKAFYRNSNYHLSPDRLNGAALDVLGGHGIEVVRRRIEELFEQRFEPNCHVSANRYTAGQGTLIHTDFDPNGRGEDPFFFTHRFLVYLNRGWSPGQGGVLGLFESPDSTVPSAAIEPVHNRGVGLAIGPRSHHAVAAVKGAQRFTLNFCFRSLTGDYELPG